MKRYNEQALPRCEEIEDFERINRHNLACGVLCYVNKGNVMKEGYWVICTNGYEINGRIITTGEMEFYESKRNIINDDWRRATKEEIDTRERSISGKYYNLKNV